VCVCWWEGLCVSLHVCRWMKGVHPQSLPSAQFFSSSYNHPPIHQHIHTHTHTHTQYMQVYLTEHPDFNRTRDHPKFLLWEEHDLTFAWDTPTATYTPTDTDTDTHTHTHIQKNNTREKTMNVTLTEAARRNGSVYAHVFFIREDYEFDPFEQRLWSYRCIRKY
jgi:hypothetical protein